MLRQIARYVFRYLPAALLATWFWTAGSYSPTRDFAIAALVALAFVWIDKRRHLQTWNSASRSALSPTLAATLCWSMAVWVSSSILDQVFPPVAPPLRGQMVSPPGMDPSRSDLHVGVAMSGGGYRAALVHAGVLQELSERGIPVTNISSVSGGSIIASFVAMGGSPADFADLVKAGRFRLVREMTSALNLPRWLWPMGSFGRRDVQAALLRRVLLSNTMQETQGPLLMLGATDLANAMSMGLTDDGFQIVGIAFSRFFVRDSGMSLDNDGDLADRVALSGAFPGVFPAKLATARYTLSEESLAKSRFVRTLELALVDGGARDNLGLNLLLAIDREARGTGNTSLPWHVFKPGPEWKLDVIIISDGGQSLDRQGPALPLLGQIMRAIEVSGLATGIFRPIDSNADLPVIALSIASQLALSPGTEIVDLPGADPHKLRWHVFKPQLLSDHDLDRIVEMNPRLDATRAALAKFRSFGRNQIDLTDIQARCKTRTEETQSCAWFDLVSLVMEDIEAVTETFRRSPTLLDQYAEKDANALVRLGRYFVLLTGHELDDAVNRAAGKAP